MKSRKATKINSLLFAIFIVSMMFVATVNATENSETFDSSENTVIKGKDVIEIVDNMYALDDKEDSRDVLTYSPSRSFSWQASSDVYRFLSPGFLSYSRSRIDGSPYDIDEISVRGRLWADDDLEFDQTDTQYNSADAGISYSFTILTGTDFIGRGNHVFEEGNSYWYPTTEDTLHISF
jgi:hypothetical protein